MQKMKIIIQEEFFSVEECSNKSDHLYIYGDNIIHKGAKGQAIIRYLSNAMGIPTKKFPNNRPSSYLSDDEYENNCELISESIDRIVKLADSYVYLVLPANGLGTGLAKLNIVAPQTYKYLNDKIRELIYQVGGDINIWKY